MAYDVVVIGGGRIGSVTARFLEDLGFSVLVVERDSGRARFLENRGFSVVRLDALSGKAIGLVKSVGVGVLALPGSIGYYCLKKLVEAGVELIVDVSFYAEDPLMLNGLAKSSGSRVVVDAGLAPGLSNLFIGYAYSKMGLLDYAEIYVGGLALNPNCPLGLAYTWNIRDLLEEYIRPARVVVNGRVEYRDPLDYTGRVEVPGKGVFEYFVSDGLRTMLSKKLALNMAEYTLRYIGHLDRIRVLRDLGFLDYKGVRVGECEADVLDFTASILGLKLAECTKDRVVMYVRAGKGSRVMELFIDEVYDDLTSTTAMAKTTSSVQACTTKVLADNPGIVDLGVHGLEDLGLLEKAYDRIMECVRKYVGSLRIV